MNKLAITVALAIAALGLTVTPAHAAELVAIPPSITPPTCEHPTTMRYEVPFSSGVRYDVQEVGPVESITWMDAAPGTYEASVSERVYVRAYNADDLTFLNGWVLAYSAAKGCPIQPRAQARIVGRCKSWSARLVVREIEAWQVLSRDAEFEVTVNHRAARTRTLGVGEVVVTGASKRNGKAKTVRVYEDGDLITSRTFRCGR